MNDSESLYAIRQGLGYMTLLITTMFFYFAVALPFKQWADRKLRRMKTRLALREKVK
jgi:hypothetical protein